MYISKTTLLNTKMNDQIHQNKNKCCLNQGLPKPIKIFDTPRLTPYSPSTLIALQGLPSISKTKINYRHANAPITHFLIVHIQIVRQTPGHKES